MDKNQKCPYCGKPLIMGKAGNTRGCMVCDKLVCTNCSKHSICKIHFDPANPEQESELKQNYRKYWIFFLIGLGCLFLLIYGFVALMDLLPDYSLLLLVLDLSMIPLFFVFITKLRKIFVKQAKKIFGAI